MATTDRFTVYRVPAQRRLGVAPTAWRLIALPAGHILDDTEVMGVVRLGLPDGVDVVQRSTDDLNGRPQPIVGSYEVRWEGEESVIEVTDGVAGRYTLRRLWDDATLPLVRLAVLA
jgi:hypothetical protein